MTTAFFQVLATSLAAVTPASSLTIEQFREQQFMDAAVARLRAAEAAGLPLERVVQTMAEEQTALVLALTDPAIAQVAGEALFRAKQATVTDPRYTTSAEEARDTMGQILLRRAAEAQANVVKLGEPATMATLLAAARNPAAPPFTTAPVAQVKAAETFEELRHAGADGKSQVLAHIKQFQEGMIITHGALAQVFAPQGALHQALLKTVALHLPNASPAAVEAVVGPWLAAREGAAQATVDQASNNGQAYQLAVALSLKDHPSAMAPATAPANTNLPPPVNENQPGFVAKIQAEKATPQNAGRSS